jgi:hypothetical protein
LPLAHGVQTLAGVAFHSANMELDDRTLVEELFRQGDLLVGARNLQPTQRRDIACRGSLTCSSSGNISCMHNRCIMHPLACCGKS